MTRAVETRGGQWAAGSFTVAVAVLLLMILTAPATAHPSNGGDCTRCHKQGPPTPAPTPSTGVDGTAPTLPAPAAETEEPAPTPAAPTPSAASPTTVAPTQQPETSPSSGLSSQQPVPQTQQPANSSSTTTPAAANPARDATTANPASATATGTGATASTTPAATPHPGDFAEDLARAEAERGLPPPLPIVRIDRPEFVFSGADPVIAAGVAAWLATLEGPHDQFGTFMGPGYTGSYRPDSVNSQLIAFLANFCKDQRLVAISEGQAAALAAAQEQSRRDAVEAAVNARREAASRPSTPASSSTNGHENVPAIGSSSDRSSPATTPAASTPATSTAATATTSS
jgi:hypothetical protein